VIGSDGKCRLGIGRQCDSSVGTLLEYILGQSTPSQHFPLVHGSVNAARHQASVVRTPHDALHLAVVTLQVGDVLKAGCRVDLHHVAVDGRQVMSTVAEAALSSHIPASIVIHLHVNSASSQTHITFFSGTFRNMKERLPGPAWGLYFRCTFSKVFKF